MQKIVLQVKSWIDPVELGESGRVATWGEGDILSDCKSLMISQKYEVAANKSMLKILDSTFILKMNYLNFLNHMWKIVFGMYMYMYVLV